MGKCSQKRKTNAVRAQVKRPRTMRMEPLYRSGPNRAERRAALQRPVSAPSTSAPVHEPRIQPSNYPRASLHDLSGMLRAARKRLHRAKYGSPEFGQACKRYEERLAEWLGGFDEKGAA